MKDMESLHKAELALEDLQVCFIFLPIFTNTLNLC